MLAAASGDLGLALIELGAIALGLAALARLSDRLGVSPIPAYVGAGLLFGQGGIVAPAFSSDFLEVAAELGVVLLLFTLGLEYSPAELEHSLRAGWRAGLVDLVANATPGFAAGMLLGWDTTAAVLLAGVTYISSSGVVSKVLTDLGRLGNRETPAVLTILVIEDLVMAAYLPVVGVMLAAEPFDRAVVAVVLALSTAAVVLVIALRFGSHVSRAVAARTDEALLLGVLGLTLLVAGAAQALEVSAAVGAFLVGIAVSGPVQERVSNLIGPLRDLFAAIFFVLFSLRIDPATLPPVLIAAAALAVVTALTKFGTGWWAAARAGIQARGRVRAGSILIARGEFSIVIAGLAIGASVEPDLVPLSAAYVLILAIAGPVLTRFADPITNRLRRAPAPRPAGSADGAEEAPAGPR